MKDVGEATGVVRLACPMAEATVVSRLAMSVVRDAIILSRS